MEFEFSNVFELFDNAGNEPNNQPLRLSSSHVGNRREVNVPMDENASANITFSSVVDADKTDAVDNAQPASINTAASTFNYLHPTASTATTITATSAITTHTAPATAITTATASDNTTTTTISTSGVSTHKTITAGESNSEPAVVPANIPVAANLNNGSTPTSAAACAVSKTNSANENVTVHASTSELSVNLPPVLAVANRPLPKKWYYLCRFKPHENENNIINYITAKTECDRNEIICHKLVRKERNVNSPLSFISFKLSVPDCLYDLISTPNFWPTGVKISPFLDRRFQHKKAIPVNSTANLPAQSLRTQRTCDQLPNDTLPCQTTPLHPMLQNQRAVLSSLV